MKPTRRTIRSVWPAVTAMLWLAIWQPAPGAAQAPDIVYVVRGITASRVPDFFGKLPLAVQDLRTVVTMKETNAASVPDAAMPSVYLHLGHAYKKTNQLPEARSVWEKGKSAYPAAPEARAIDEELQRL